ncbi:MAG: VIT1/CCC1 transporter family protein [Candidatus Wukongarchaeota archaeon]|jgi:VIT1/CCC1 family predicted Fe2+/Mn2+ transporter|nr:VIT1/CCC1 transporter family protein [Candidatus Wukongarchaeota archaeon]
MQKNLEKYEILDEETKKHGLALQKDEITGYHLYERLSRSTKDPHNKKVLKDIAEQELGHYHVLKTYTGRDVKSSKLTIWFYLFLSKIFGITFAIKLMERGEEEFLVSYSKISKSIPEVEAIIKDEEEHEKLLIDMIDEERLRYMDSMVLGLNDALVELTGMLAGLTLALQDTQIIALVGLITGIAASLSMASSEYLSTKTEGGSRNPLRASVYTGSSYILTVLLLIFPFFLFTSIYFALGFTIFNAILIIFIFTFYIAVTKELSFKKRFSEMATISLGIAAISFCIGYLIRIIFNVDI